MVSVDGSDEVLTNVLDAYGQPNLLDDSSSFPSKAITAGQIDHQLLMETKAMSNALAAQSIEVESSIMLNSKVVIEVRDKIDEGVKILDNGSRVRSSTSQKTHLKSTIDLLEGTLDEVVNEINKWTEMVEAISIPKLPPDTIDLLSEHAIEVLEGERLQHRIRSLEMDLEVLRNDPQ